jgi:hypothetical protein
MGRHLDMVHELRWRCGAGDVAERRTISLEEAVARRVPSGPDGPDQACCSLAPGSGPNTCTKNCRYRPLRAG